MEFRPYILAIFMISCASPHDSQWESALHADGGSECLPVRASMPVAAGDVLTSGLRSLTVDNGIVRLQYGSRALDWRDQGVGKSGLPVVQNNERHLDHFLEARHTDAPEVTSETWNGLGNGDPNRGSVGCRNAACHDGSGTHWHDAVYSWYGDGAAYSSGAVSTDADRVYVLRADDDAIELSYEWDSISLDGLRAPESCILGRYPECGPTSRDHEGQAVYIHNLADTVKSVKHVRLWKTVRIERCSPGYFVSLRSDPPLPWPEQGPRAERLGYVSTAVAWSCDGAEAVHHPDNGQHYNFAPTDCIADIPASQTGHEGWPFVRFMVTPGDVQFSSLQYGPAQLGSPGARDLVDAPGRDGRPEPWQAFIGAVEYVSPNMAAEPSSESLGLAQNAAAITWPER